MEEGQGESLPLGRGVEGPVALLTALRDLPGELVLPGQVILGSVHLEQGQPTMAHGPNPWPKS